MTQHRFLSTHFSSRRWDYEKKTRVFSCNTKQCNQSYHLMYWRRRRWFPPGWFTLIFLVKYWKFTTSWRSANCNFLTFRFCNYSLSGECNGDVEKLANESHSKVNEREKLVRQKAAPARAGWWNKMRKSWNGQGKRNWNRVNSKLK